jgi:hypothetical protein
VHVEDHRQSSPGTSRSDDAGASVTDRGGHRDPLFVDGRLLDRRRVDVVHEVASLRVVQFVEARSPGHGLEHLDCGLENERGQ